jgi:hypothetical protein
VAPSSEGTEFSKAILCSDRIYFSTFRYFGQRSGKYLKVEKHIRLLHKIAFDNSVKAIKME